MKPSFTRRILYGAAYYPEHWDRKLWARDARLMKDAGFNVVRVGEFAWCYFEPEENRFEFDWLDEAIDRLAGAGIGVIVGTPTATIPAWMAHAYPEVMAVGEDGRRRRFGIRKDYCYSHPQFDRLAMRIVERVARHYGRDRRVIGFQTDNEFMASPCRCDLCRERYRRFLRKKYRTIAALNRAWGTWFWGTRYNRFEQIDWPPVGDNLGPNVGNPSAALDARRFWSWVDIEHQARQMAVLRRHAPGKLITHNLMGLYPWVDYYALGRDLDFVSWDNYPSLGAQPVAGRVAVAHAVMWSIRRSNFLVMEQQSGPGGWASYLPQSAPGQTALWAWQAIARGADGISYFRWRTSIAGQEQYWHGILNHDNVPRRRYFEVAGMGRQLRALSRRILGTRPVAEIGLYYNYDQIWATQYQPQNAAQPVDFQQQIVAFAEAILPLGADFGVCSNHDPNLDRYRLVFCPPLYLADPRLVTRLAAYVRGGGHLVLTARTGVKNLTNVNLMARLPGPFRSLAGVEVEEYSVVPEGAPWTVDLPAGHISAERIRECLRPARGTEVVGVHQGDYLAGRAAVTRRRFGRGTVWYIGTLPSHAGWAGLMPALLDGAGVTYRTDLPAGIELARRRGPDRALTFVLNHTGEPKTVGGLAPAVDLMSGQRVTGSLELAPYGVALLLK